MRPNPDFIKQTFRYLLVYLHALRSLITSNPATDYAKPTFAAAQALLNNYQMDVTVAETLTPQMLAEETTFIDVVMENNVLQTVHQFLVSKGIIFLMFCSSVSDKCFLIFAIQARPVLISPLLSNF